MSDIIDVNISEEPVLEVVEVHVDENAAQSAIDAAALAQNALTQVQSLVANIADVNTILNDAGFVKDATTFTGNENSVWNINGVEYTNPADVIINIPLAATGMQRWDRIVLNTSNSFERVPGPELETNPPVPSLPDNTLDYTLFLVTDSTVGDPSPPIVGDVYKKKIENTRWKSTQSGSNVVIPFQAAGQSHYSVVHSGLISVAGFTTAALTSPMYEGQDVLFENQTGNPITLKDSFGGVNTPFDLGADLVVPNEGKIWFRSRNGLLELIMKSWSEASDVLEFANLAGFPATGESGKIYIALDTNFTYRWSGSSYVQIGGNGDTIAYFFQGGVSMPTINTWYANNLGFAINGTTTFGSGTVPSGVYFSIGALPIPSGYILEKIIFGEYFNPTGLTHELEIAVLRGEYGIDALNNTLSAYETLVHQTLSIGYLTTSPKYFKELTIASHSAKERSALQVYMRQKTNNSQSGYSMTFIFKKA